MGGGGALDSRVGRTSHLDFKRGMDRWHEGDTVSPQPYNPSGSAAGERETHHQPSGPYSGVDGPRNRKAGDRHAGGAPVVWWTSLGQATR